jgi:hypothetical protein
MSVELIYKTTSPQAIEWWLSAAAKVKADKEARSAYVKRMTEEFGKPDVPDYFTPREQRDLWVRNDRPIALDSGPDEKPPADSGWRLDSKDRNWQPKLATKRGKERAAELAELFTYDMRRDAKTIGVPEMVFADHSLLRPGMDFDEDERALYVVWSSGKAAKEFEAAAVEGIEWTEVPRSQWYAREEAREPVSA